MQSAGREGNNDPMTANTKELEQRLSTALARLAGAVGALSAPMPKPAPTPTDTADLDALRAQLAQERETNAGLVDRIADLRNRQDDTIAGLEKRQAAADATLDQQGVELQRLRQSNVQLRETLRALREAAEAGVADAHGINKALQAELDALRATRMAEIAEMDEIIAEIDPLLDPQTAEVSDARD